MFIPTRDEFIPTCRDKGKNFAFLFTAIFSEPKIRKIFNKCFCFF